MKVWLKERDIGYLATQLRKAGLEGKMMVSGVLCVCVYCVCMCCVCVCVHVMAILYCAGCLSSQQANS